MKRVTDLYGDAPFSQANQVNNNVYLPKYDKQEDIYKQIITDLKAGRDAVNSASTVPSGDILYYGNMNRWKTCKFCNFTSITSVIQEIPRSF